MPKPRDTPHPDRDTSIQVEARTILKHLERRTSDHAPKALKALQAWLQLLTGDTQ